MEVGEGVPLLFWVAGGVAGHGGFVQVGPLRESMREIEAKG